MPDRQPQGATPATNPPTCTPLPGATMPWPTSPVNCNPASPDRVHGGGAAPLSLDILFSLPSGVSIDEDTTLLLVYTVNGSLDYSALFSQPEVSRNSAVKFHKGQTEAKVTIVTLPILPNTTFELEVLAYAARAGTIISGPVQVKTEAAEDKSLKALSVLATTALVTALGALAFALLKPRA